MWGFFRMASKRQLYFFEMRLRKTNSHPSIYSSAIELKLVFGFVMYQRNMVCRSIDRLILIKMSEFTLFSVAWSPILFVYSVSVLHIDTLTMSCFYYYKFCFLFGAHCIDNSHHRIWNCWYCAIINVLKSGNWISAMSTSH